MRVSVHTPVASVLALLICDLSQADRHCMRQAFKYPNKTRHVHGGHSVFDASVGTLRTQWAQHLKTFQTNLSEKINSTG